MLNRRFVILWLIMFVNGIASAPVIALFSVYIDADVHQTPLFAASYRAIFMLLGGLFSIAGGALCDSLGRKRTFLLGLSGSLALVSVFLVGNPLVLLLLFLYAGVTTGLLATAGQSYMMAAVPKTTMGTATAVYFLGYTLSSSIGNYAIGRIVDASSFRSAGLVLFVLALFTIIIAVPMLPALPLEGNGRTFSFADTLAGYKQIVIRSEVMLLLGIRFIPTFYWGIATLLIPLLIYRATQSTADAARYASVSLLIAAAFQLLTGRIIDKVGYRAPVLITVSILPLAALFTALFARSLTGLFASGVLGAAAAWSLATTIPGLVRSVAGEAEQGRILGTTELAWSLGMFSGNLVGGQLVEFSPGLPFSIAALLLLPAIVMAWRLLRLGLRSAAVTKTGSVATKLKL
jgi:MFS family permease